MGKAYPDRIIMNRAMLEAAMTSASDDRIWRSYDSGEDRLDNSLGPAIRAIGIQSLASAAEWLKTRSCRQPTGLEIAGQGKAFVKRMAGIANCLAVPEFLIEQPQTTSLPRRRYARPPITFVPGNIAEEKTWNEIEAAAQHELPDSPNLILFTPSDGGMATMPERPEFYESVVVRALALARPGPLIMVGEMMSAYSGKLERLLLSMHRRQEAEVAIISRIEYGLFALVRS